MIHWDNEEVAHSPAGPLHLRFNILIPQGKVSRPFGTQKTFNGWKLHFVEVPLMGI